MKTGIELIEEERKRQIEIEGWSSNHDDSHDDGDLAKAAICYTASAVKTKGISGILIDFWPWSVKWWKPKNSIRDLVKAGALIAAEIDRIQRTGT